MNNLPVLIIILPLSAALLSLVLSQIHYHLGRDIVFLSFCGSLVCSILQLQRAIAEGPIHYRFGNYQMPIGIEFVIDTVNAIMLVMICIMGVLTCIYSARFAATAITDKNKLRTGGMYTMLALLVVGMAGMTSTGDIFNLYVFLEITSLSGYCLIAMGGSKGMVSSFRYLLIGTVAATFYLLGAGILYGATGSLNMQDIAQIIGQGGEEYNEAMLVAMCLFIGAFGIKMALFPFHGWQPSAYAHAPNGARPIIAGVMGKIPAYAMFRYLYCVYGTDYVYFKYFLIIIGVLSCGGMIYGSICAMAQKDIRKMLDYSSVAQIGYISLGFAVGTPLALAGAFLHMLGHCFMKGGLFFATGAIRYKYGTVNLNDFGRIYKKMPLTAGLLVIGALSMVGIPPTVGFFSKWYLAVGSAQAGDYIYIFVLVISSLLNAIYFFKLIEKIFIQDTKEPVSEMPVARGEVPISMIIPIVFSFLAILCLGIFNVPIIDTLMLTLEGVGI